jgi:hypothetical protein
MDKFLLDQVTTLFYLSKGDYLQHIVQGVDKYLFFIFSFTILRHHITNNTTLKLYMYWIYFPYPLKKE